jgi:hypothetical protein
MKIMRGLLVVLAVLAGGGVLFAQEAFIKEFTGTVEIQEAGAAVWSRVEAGQQLRKDTIISTGFKSAAVISLGNSSLLVQPLTRLSLEELTSRQENEEVRLYLNTGRIRVEVTPPAGGKTDFTIRSPTITASVRGTAFDFDGVNLRVDEGVVHVLGGDSSGVYVGARHRAVSDPETGRTAAGIEAAIAELSPAISEAAAESIKEPAATLPELADFGFGFTW